MSDKVSRGNARVPVQYHEFDISDEDGPTGPGLERGHNALVRVADGVTIVIHTGDVDVTVTLHEKEPAPDDSNWQEIVEVSAHSLIPRMKRRIGLPVEELVGASLLDHLTSSQS
jgi:hypothetical protein